MAYLIDRINEELRKTGYKPRSNSARDWLRAKISELNLQRNAVANDKNRFKSDTIIGKMYFYYYDAKTKDMLPYWDKFPLVIPLEVHTDGFIGLNLHYKIGRAHV